MFLKNILFYTVTVSLSWCVLIHAQEYEENDPNHVVWRDEIEVSPFEVGVGDNIKRVSRQQKWHRVKRLVRGEAQVFSCMQEKT